MINLKENLILDKMVLLLVAFLHAVIGFSEYCLNSSYLTSNYFWFLIFWKEQNNSAKKKKNSYNKYKHIFNKNLMK